MLVLLFCKLSEQYSQTTFPIIKPFKVTKKRMADIYISIIICYINLVRLYMMRQQPYCATTHQLTGGEETEWWNQSVYGDD